MTADGSKMPLGDKPVVHDADLSRGSLIGPTKNSKKVRVRTCSETLTIPSEDGQDDVRFKCSLSNDPTPEGKHHEHRSNGIVFRRNGTAARYTVSWTNLGRIEARRHL